MNFGEYLKQKRTEKGVNLRKLAGLLEIAPAYLSDIEKGKRNPPSLEIMNKIVETLDLNETDRNTFFDIAAKERENTVAPDISHYITENATVRVALRKAQSLNLSDLEWVKIIENMEAGEQSN